MKVRKNLLTQPKYGVISADCTTTILDPDSDFKIEESQLPAEDGMEISYSCLKKHAKKGSNVRAVCEDGVIIFTNGSPDCFKIGPFVSE